MSLVITYIATAVMFLVLDLFWLGYFARDFYSSQMGPLLAADTRAGVAAGFYALYIIGIIYFAILPAADGTSPVIGAALKGLAFGLFCYGTYNLTNLATTAGWPWALPFVDMAWGSVLTGAAAAAGAYALTFARA